MSITPTCWRNALWPAIESALGQSEYFLLLASPEAAASPWVGREVEWWLDNRSAERLLVLATDGELAWDEAREISIEPAIVEDAGMAPESLPLTEPELVPEPIPAPVMDIPRDMPMEMDMPMDMGGFD